MCAPGFLLVKVGSRGLNCGLFDSSSVYVYGLGAVTFLENNLAAGNYLRMHESVQAKRFLNLELDLAITFCDTGFAMSDRTEARRSAEHAREALDTVEKLAHTLRLTKA